MASSALPTTDCYLTELPPALAHRATELAPAGDTRLMRAIREDRLDRSCQKLGSKVCYQLIMQSGPLAGRIIVIERPVLHIGRQSTNDIVIPDPTVSRRHARLAQVGDELLLTDKHSCNGTIVNGCRITA